MTILAGLLIFILNALNDVFAVSFVRQVGKGNAGWASLCAVGIEIIAFLTILSWVESMWFIIPASLGVAAGTFGTVTYNRRKEVGSENTEEG